MGLVHAAPRGLLVVTLMGVAGCRWFQQEEPGSSGSEVTASEGLCHKARRLEQAADYEPARRAYEACIRDGGGFVDSHLGYQQILEVEDGPEVARQTYEALVEEVEAPMVRWAASRLKPRDERIAALESIVAREPDFIVAYYDLSRQYAAEEVGTQSLDDKATEMLYLTQFLERARKGDAFAKMFTSYDAAAQMLRDAERRLQRLENVDLSAREAPVELVAMPHNAGWSLTFQVKETATEVQSKLAGETEWESGWSRQIPPTSKGQTITVRYKGVRDQWHGPYELDFDPRAGLVSFVKRTLEQIGPHTWLAVQAPTGTPNLYFTILFTYRCGIDKVEYGIDTDPPNRVKKLPACDPEDPYAIHDTEGMFEPLAPGTKFISYRITFADGEQSEVHRLEVD